MKFRHLIATALLAVACSGQAAVVYGSNLVVNGDAEAGTAGWNGYDVYSPIQMVDYGPVWVQPTQPGPVDRGAHMFTGTGQYAVAIQTLDFGTATTQATAFSLSGWLGGWSDQGDNAVFSVQFLDAFGNDLGASYLDPVTAADRNNQTGLFYRDLDGFMPAGTSQVTFYLSMERQGGGDNDGYADNLSFVLDAPAGEVPEPGMASLLLLSLGALGWARRRRAG